LTNTPSIDLVAGKGSINSFAERAVTTVDQMDEVIQGKATFTFGGPKNFLPSNGAHRIVKFGGNPATGHAGGSTDEYTMRFGDRKETINVGDHNTTINIGNMAYRTGTGSWEAGAGSPPDAPGGVGFSVNAINLDAKQGLTARVLTGNINVTGSATANISALATMTVKAKGVMSVSGATITLGGNGKVGGILSGADVDPVSGKTFAALGLGSTGHFLGPNI
jgi:hypothetical protein